VVVLRHNIVYDDVIVAAISSVAKRHNFSDTILISSSEKNFSKTGLKKQSVILTNKIVTINKNRLFHKLGNLPDFYLDELDKKILSNFKIGLTNSTNSTTFIPYGRQTIDDDDVYSVVKTLRSDWLTQGPKVAEFESALCDETDADFAVCLNSGTSALHIACLAAGVSHGDEVITSPISFVASANCAVYCGARPVFADIYSDTYNISPEEIKKKITSHTKAIIPVHFAGQSCDMDAIRKIVSAAENKYGHKIYVIEDACHALGSIYKNKKVGSCAFSDMTVMSFHPVKHITTGEGGVVLTNDEVLANRMRLFRNHGITRDPKCFSSLTSDLRPLTSDFSWYYEQIALGYNYRITDIQCALGLSQLKKFSRFCKRRREIVNQYNTAFKDLRYIQIPFEANSCDSNFHLYVLLFDFDKIGLTRAQLMAELKRRGIQTQVHYIPVHTQPYYQKKFTTKWGDCPNAEEYYKKCLSIPLYPAMTVDDVGKVITAITNIPNF
jgi:UDP-4-amino-4,6-dideoxy-N-acetyl-beta-L-altrosamine transaminase